MTKQEDADSEYEAQVEMARYLRKYIRKRQRAHLPRYKGGGRLKNRISMYRRTGNDRVEFRLSYDVVCRLYGWSMHFMDEPPRDLLTDKGHRVHIMTFKRKSTPLLLIRLVEFSPTDGQRLTRKARTWQFTASISAKKIGIDPDAPSLPAPRIVPYPALKGYLIVLPDTHRAYKARRDDVEALLATIDPDEPPRFRHGQRDPAYLAKLAAEAERTNQ